MNITCVSPDKVADYWPRFSGLIKPALEDTLTDFSCVACDVLAGRNLLWFAWVGSEVYAAAVTSLAVANGKKFMTIVACGGREMESWKPLIATLEKHARDEGCQSVAIFGRPGWERIYPQFKRTGVILEKELT